jgi:hypothetical protein
MRVTCSLTRSASRSSLSPGTLTRSFVWIPEENMRCIVWLPIVRFSAFAVLA